MIAHTVKLNFPAVLPISSLSHWVLRDTQASVSPFYSNHKKTEKKEEVNEKGLQSK